MPTLKITQAHLKDPSQSLDKIGDIYIDNDTIVGIDQAPEGFNSDNTFDANGTMLMPGFIDLCARLGEPGYERKGTVESETYAAIRGGVTTLCCPPNTAPIIDTPAVIKLIQQKQREAGYAQVHCIGALTQDLAGEQLSEMHALKEAGCIALSNLREPIKDTRTLQRCLEYATTHELRVIFHSEDHSLAKGGCAHDGALASRLGLVGIPETAETIALSRDLLMVEQTGVQAHFAKISTARGVELIADAQKRGLPVTADTAIHHLFFTERHLEGFNSLYHTQPPLRSEADRQALIQGIKDGVIAAVCSDHTPHEPAAKAAPFAETEPGMNNIEFLWPLLFQLSEQGDIDFDTALSCITSGPAKVLGLDHYGSLNVGSHANICLFDPKAEWSLPASESASKSQNSPFFGQRFTGRVLNTWVNGHSIEVG